VLGGDLNDGFDLHQLPKTRRTFLWLWLCFHLCTKGSRWKRTRSCQRQIVSSRKRRDGLETRLEWRFASRFVIVNGVLWSLVRLTLGVCETDFQCLCRARGADDAKEEESHLWR
jgi:hypothetical protein